MVVHVFTGNGRPVLREAADAKRLTADTLNSVGWLPADKELVEKIKALL